MTSVESGGFFGVLEEELAILNTGPWCSLTQRVRKAGYLALTTRKLQTDRHQDRTRCSALIALKRALVLYS